MLQRPQHIFLLAILLLLIVGFFLPIWTKYNKSTQQKATLNYAFFSYQKSKTTTNTPTPKTEQQFSFLSLLAGITIVVAGYSIWVGQQASTLAKAQDRFKKRLLQMKLGLFISILLSGMLGLTVYYTSQGENLFIDEVKQTNSLAKFEIGFYLLIAALLLNLVSNRFIRREQKMIESSDRLR